MRKHGWQLPYHPLQVVAVAVFLALGFSFYVFFAPFVGKQLFQYTVMGIYTPLLICAFGLYIWCAAADPADPGVFRSKKYVNIQDNQKHTEFGESKHGEESIRHVNASADVEETNDKGNVVIESSTNCNTGLEKKSSSHRRSNCLTAMSALLPCACICYSSEDSSNKQSEDGMFYCSLCEVEVCKYSKHCRVCDKCVDHFDHHCRWLNNCVGKGNYRKFFTLMVSSLLLLILQCSTGILVIILCFLEKKRFATELSSKLGSSFTVAPFIIVVAVCTILAMIATLPLAQLFFFHILLIKKGISTYDYIIALREQEQQDVGLGGQQTPQMSPVSSLTGLSSVSSFNAFHRAAWCTPPRLFVDNQFDAVPLDNGSVSSLGKRSLSEEPSKKKNPAAVKISPWTLARLNAEDVSKAAADARKKSKILRPVARHEPHCDSGSAYSNFGSGDHGMTIPSDDNRKKGSKRICLPSGIPSLDPQNTRDRRHHTMTTETLGSLSTLHLEAPSAFRANCTIPGIVASSPESSLDSPDVHPLRLSSSGAAMATPLSSDGYDASGGEDSDRVPARFIHRPSNWSNRLFGSDHDSSLPKSISTSSSTVSHYRRH